MRADLFLFAHLWFFAPDVINARNNHVAKRRCANCNMFYHIMNYITMTSIMNTIGWFVFAATLFEYFAVGNLLLTAAKWLIEHYSVRMIAFIIFSTPTYSRIYGRRAMTAMSSFTAWLNGIFEYIIFKCPSLFALDLFLTIDCTFWIAPSFIASYYQHVM